jgi:hypothetical protein
MVSTKVRHLALKTRLTLQSMLGLGSVIGFLCLHLFVMFSFRYQSLSVVHCLLVMAMLVTERVNRKENRFVRKPRTFGLT